MTGQGMRTHAGFVGLALLCLLCAGPAAAAGQQDEQERNAQEAVGRVVESHDHTLLVGGAKLMIKQSAVRSARRLLLEWGRDAGLGGEWWDDAPEYRAAKAELLGIADAAIAQRVQSGVWVREAWSEYTAREFNGEEADVIANHFQTEGGRKQRMLMDWYLGEFVLFNYTFTDRFDYELKEAEEELLALQKQAQGRIPREDVEFSSRYPDAFGSSRAARTAGTAGREVLEDARHPAAGRAAALHGPHQRRHRGADAQPQAVRRATDRSVQGPAGRRECCRTTQVRIECKSDELQSRVNSCGLKRGIAARCCDGTGDWLELSVPLVPQSPTSETIMEHKLLRCRTPWTRLPRTSRRRPSSSTTASTTRPTSPTSTT
jgi:hypothetical protein